MQGRLLKQVSLSSFICMVAILFSGCNSHDKQIELALEKAVARLNKQFPIVVDAGLRLDSCTAGPGKILSCYYTVMDDSLFNLQEFEEISIPFIRNTWKTNPNMDFYREVNTTIQYKYLDTTGREVYAFDIHPNDYK